MGASAATARFGGSEKGASARSVWTFVSVVFFLSRLLFLGAGALAALLLPQADPAGDPLGPAGFLGYWALWDGAWYAEIATEGYGERAPASTAFFPLYPMLVKIGAAVGAGAGVFGALAAATRNVGVLLLVPLFAEWARHRGELGSRGLVGMALVPAGLAAYAAYLWARFGDPLLFARQQDDYWNREISGPLATLGDAWTAAGVGMRYVLDPATLFLGTDATPALEASNVLNLVFLVFFLAVALAGLYALPPGLWVYTVALVLLPALAPSPRFPLMSLPRFVLGAFPVFLVLGYLLSRSRWALAGWLFFSGGIGVALTALFVTWRWVA